MAEVDRETAVVVVTDVGEKLAHGCRLGVKCSCVGFNGLNGCTRTRSPPDENQISECGDEHCKRHIVLSKDNDVILKKIKLNQLFGN